MLIFSTPNQCNLPAICLQNLEPKCHRFYCRELKYIHTCKELFVKHNFEFKNNLMLFFVQSTFYSCTFYISGFIINHTQKNHYQKKNPGSFKSKLEFATYCIVFITIYLVFALYKALYIIKGDLKYTEDVLGDANTMPLNIRKLHICGFWYP